MACSGVVEPRDRKDSNWVEEQEPWMVVDTDDSPQAMAGPGAPVTRTSTSSKFVCKVCHAGSVVWVTIDSTSLRSYDFLSSELQLAQPIFVVNGNENNLVRSTSDLQRVLKTHVDQHTPLHLEVQLENSLKQNILAQSFVFLENFDPEELLQSMKESMQEFAASSATTAEASSNIVNPSGINVSSSSTASFVSELFASAKKTNAVVKTIDTTASSASASAASTSAATDSNINNNNSNNNSNNSSNNSSSNSNNSSSSNNSNNSSSTFTDNLATQFPYHCPNATIRAWLHAVFHEHTEDAEMKVLSLKNLYSQVLCKTVSASNSLLEHGGDDRRRTQYEQIELDIPRTFSLSKDESRIERDAKLRRILRATSQRITSGYVQGQNFIIGYLLTVSDVEADIFALFVGLMENGPTSPTLLQSRYGLVGMFDHNMPRLNALVYTVDHLLPAVSPELHHHLVDKIGIATSLLYVPGWSLTMFTNRLGAQSVAPLFDQIMHGGFHAIIRLCLATLKAHEKELLLCTFEEALQLLQQHLWLRKDVTKNIIESLLELEVDDALLFDLEKQYATGDDVGIVSNQQKKKSNDRKKKFQEPPIERVNKKVEESFLGIPGMTKSTATVTGIVGATILAGLGALLFTGGGESGGQSMATTMSRNNTSHERKNEE